MQRKVLVKAIALAATGVGMSLGAAGGVSADVMYNTYLGFGIDGWVTNDGRGGAGAAVPWLGAPGGALPFGFTAEAHAANWAAQINASGESMEVSAADAAARFNGTFVDLDTANGSWGSWPSPLDAAADSRGWAHNTDFGLIRSAVDTTVRIDVSKVNPADNISNFGITVFEGMNTGGFSHHAAWNAVTPSPLNGPAVTADNPFNAVDKATGISYGSGNIYLTHGTNSYVEFFARANQVYTIALGGNDINGDKLGTGYGYKAMISAVPVPAAVWMFGSGLLGLFGVSRRKHKDA